MKVIEAKIVVLGSQVATATTTACDRDRKPRAKNLEAKARFYGNKGVNDITRQPAGVGKTSLVVRYIGKMFSKHISPTIGASFFTCNINVEGARVKLQVWDTAGQERFRSMAPMYYRNANAALLVYDITSVGSFVAIKSWVKELQSNVPEPMILALVGNKCDLSDSRAVPLSEAKHFAAAIGAQYCETSALHDQGIDQVFLSTATALVQFSSTNLGSSLRSYDSADGDSDRVPTGTSTEDPATHTGKVELPAWSIDSIAHGEPARSLCC